VAVVELPCDGEAVRLVEPPRIRVHAVGGAKYATRMSFPKHLKPCRMTANEPVGESRLS